MPKMRHDFRSDPELTYLLAQTSEAPTTRETVAHVRRAVVGAELALFGVGAVKPAQVR
jgi:hypothetical protein